MIEDVVGLGLLGLLVSATAIWLAVWLQKNPPPGRPKIRRATRRRIGKVRGAFHVADDAVRVKILNKRAQYARESTAWDQQFKAVVPQEEDKRW